MGMFDNLIPSKDGGNMFADLIPSNKQPAAPAPETEFDRQQRATDIMTGAPTPEPAPEEPPKFTWDQLTTDKDLQDIQRNFMKIRTGKDYSNVSGEALSKDFMSSMRADEWNTFDAIAYINKLRNAPGDAKEKLALGKLVAENTKSALEKGGQPGVQPYVDAIGSALTDVTNYLGLGVTAVAKKGMATQAARAATRSALGQTVEAGVKSKAAQLLERATTMTPTKVGIAGVGTEVATGVGQDVIQQKGEIATSKVFPEQQVEIAGVPVNIEEKELDYKRVGMAALFSAVGGFADVKGQAALGTGKTGKEKLDDLLQGKLEKITDPNQPPTKAEVVLTDAVSENMDQLAEEFMKREGANVLEDIDPTQALTDSKIRKDFSARAVRVALHVMEADPAFRVKPNQKTSTAIAEVFSNLDNISDGLLEQAINKAGLTPEEFAQANKLTVTEAAQVMQQYANASKAMKRLGQIDPEFQKQVDLYFGKPNELAEASTWGSKIKRIERESKAFVVSGIGTTVRNVLGTGTVMTYRSAANLIEGSLYTLGHTVKAMSDPALSTRETFKTGMSDTIRESFSVWGHLLKADRSAAITERMLQHSPSTRSMILSASSGVDNKELSKAAQLFNSLNVAQDAFFRSAIFNASVEKNLRKVGLDPYEIMSQNKEIPASVLKEAADDSLKATFSYTPKEKKIIGEGFESGAETISHYFVKGVDALPGGSLFVTFPRFMANAIAFQYRYSPLGGTSGAADMLKGARMIADGNEAGQVLLRKGTEQFSQGVVGTSILYAAYEYRLQHQDVDAMEMQNSDGSTTNVAAIFPWGPALAVADVAAKLKLGKTPKIDEAFQAVVGMKVPAGTQNYLLQQLFNSVSSEKDADKINEMLGKVAGDFAGRFTAPGLVKSGYEFFDMFREEGAVARDPNVMTGEVGGVEVPTIAEAAAKRVQAKLPVVKESLPPTVPRMREEGNIYKEGEFFYSLLGARDTPERSPEEKQLKMLGIDPYRLYGPSSGDRVYDRAFVEAANPQVVKAVRTAMADPAYQQGSDSAKTKLITQYVSTFLQPVKSIVEAKMSAEDYDRVQKIRFNKMSPVDRKLINEEYAATHDGRTFEEDGAYNKLEEYRLRALTPLERAAGGDVSKYAGGGIVGKALTKAATTAAKELPKTSLETMLRKSTKAADEAVPASVFDQMSTVLKKEPAPTPSKPAVAAQTEQAIPAPTPKKEIASAPSETVDEYADDFFKDFEEADALYNEDPTLDMSYNFNDLSPIDPAVIGKGVIGTPIDKYTSIGGIDGAISIVRKERTDAFDKLRSDPDMLDINDSVLSTSLAKWREKDSARLAEDMGLPTDRRSPFYAPEFDIENATPEQFSNFMKIVNAEQKKYDQLSEKFKGRPPVTLFHGQEEGSKVMQNLTKKGFASPQTDPRKHAEMTIGAPSFTKDPNLNTLIPKFGGEDIGAYGSVNVPYAEYMYRRVNMPAETYDLANKGRGGDPLEALSIYNRAISGADDNAVPISLPKGYHLESEDMFIEADKLKSMGFSRPAARGGDKQARDQVAKAISEKDMTTSNLEKVGASYEKFMQGVETKRVSEKDLYKMYGDVRSLFKQELNRSTGTVSVTGGAGSRYVNTLRTMAEGQELTVPFRDDAKGLPIVDVLTKLGDEMSKLATRKESKSLAEKAKNIIEMRDLLTNIREQTVNKMGDVTPSSAKASSYSRGKIPESKMPLATSINALKKQREKLVDKRSKEWEEEVIDNLTYEIENIDADIAAKKEAIGPIESERSSKDKIMKLTDKLAKGGLVARRR